MRINYAKEGEVKRCAFFLINCLISPVKAFTSYIPLHAYRESNS